MPDPRRRPSSRKARFPRLRQIRTEQLGWDVTDIVARLPGHTPSAASIYRLELGDAIGVAHARRVSDIVNAALNNALDPANELQVT